jgi:hypothetical protein
MFRTYRCIQMLYYSKFYRSPDRLINLIRAQTENNFIHISFLYIYPSTQQSNEQLTSILMSTGFI